MGKSKHTRFNIRKSLLFRYHKKNDESFSPRSNSLDLAQLHIKVMDKKASRRRSIENAKKLCPITLISNTIDQPKSTFNSNSTPIELPLPVRTKINLEKKEKLQ